MIKGLVSIVVPVYNAERYLDSCINSIVNQSYPHLEIILVDDGSTDSSPAMCDAWAKKDSRIRVIHKRNAGAGFARNSGIDVATGEFICFFDSDDYLDSRAVEKAYTLARKETVDIVIFGSTTVDQEGNILKQHVPEAGQTCYRGESVQNVILPDLIDGKHDRAEIGNLCLSLWVCLFSMDLIRRSGWRLVSERVFASEDSYSLISLYRHVNSVAILPEALYFYRETRGSLSHSYKEDAHDRMKTFYLDCLKLSDQLGYSDEVRRRIAGLFLSQEIGVMKRIVAANLPLQEQINKISGVIRDEITQRALAEVNWHYHSRAREILFFLMRRKLCRIACILVKIQAAKAV